MIEAPEVGQNGNTRRHTPNKQLGRYQVTQNRMQKQGRNVEALLRILQSSHFLGPFLAESACVVYFEGQNIIQLLRNRSEHGVVEGPLRRTSDKRS